MPLLVNWYIVVRILENWRMEVTKTGGKLSVELWKEHIHCKKSTFKLSNLGGMMSMVSVQLKRCMT